MKIIMADGRTILRKKVAEQNYNTILNYLKNNTGFTRQEMMSATKLSYSTIRKYIKKIEAEYEGKQL